MKPKFDTIERVVKEVRPPISAPLENFWPSGQPIDTDKLKEHFIGEGRLKKEDAYLLVRRATEVFKKEPNLLEVAQPVTGKNEQ